MTTKFYQDRRSGGCLSQIKISISHNGKTAYIPTKISVAPEQWDSRAEKVVGHPQKAQLNTLLSRKKVEVDTALYELQNSGRLHGLSASEIKDAVTKHLDPDRDNTLFIPRLMLYASRCTAEATRYTYIHTAEKIRGFCNHADRLHFEDITPKWLREFNDWMATAAPSQNARNINLRCIRAVFNDAITDEITGCYPFRKYKIRAEVTKSRALTIGQVKKVFEFDDIYTDIFKLSFYLGGISMCDLCALTPDNISAGRIEFRRQKTGQMCSIGIQPEARELLDKYRGDEHLIFISDEGDYRTFLHNMNNALKHLGQTYNPKTKKWDGEAVCPTASMYWARYSVATIAADCGASADTIGAMLGHATNGVTSIYLRTNRNKQVDSAIRSAIDTINKK